MTSVAPPTYPMTQVVFVHDYIQLVFAGWILSIYNVPQLLTAGRLVTRAEPIFEDELVSLIGKRAVALAFRTNHLLSMTFENGAVVSIAASGESPEAFQIADGNTVVVEQDT